MADLFIHCYAETGRDGIYPITDKFLGIVTISTLSSTSQSATLPEGTEYVTLKTDATQAVYYAFGQDSATATTSSDNIRPDLDEKRLDRGKDGRQNNTIAARIA